MRCRKMCFFSLVVFLCTQLFIASNVRAGKSSVHFIIDCSEGMESVGGSIDKLKAASDLVNQVMNNLSESINVGLTLFSPDGNEDCGRIELTAPVGNDGRDEISKKLGDAKPGGTCPLSAGLQKTADLLSGNEDAVTIVLIINERSFPDADAFLKTARDIKEHYDYRITYDVVILEDNMISATNIISLNSSRLSQRVAFAGNGNIFRIGGSQDIGNAARIIAGKLDPPDKRHIPKVVSQEDMVLVPEGKFLMGSGPLGSNPHERPVHEVYLDAFYIDKYEVTQRQFREVMGKNPSLWIGSDMPVDSVSWQEARQFCEKVSKRLPTEAEWEKAAKGGTNDVWAGTSTEASVGDYAWCDDTRAGESSMPVGLKKPNSFGIYDMSGNLQEWVADWYALNYYSTSPDTNPKGPEHGAMRVLRGGYWDDHIASIRTTSRVPMIPEVKYASNTFRCVRSVSAEK